MNDDIDVERDDGRILVTIRETIGGTRRTITAWAEVRDELGLNKHGDAVDGLELVDETPYYHTDDPGEDDYPDGWTEVVLAFEDEETLRSARDRILEKAQKRFEWGVSDAGDVRDFASKLPTEHDVPEVEA